MFVDIVYWLINQLTNTILKCITRPSQEEEDRRWAYVNSGTSVVDVGARLSNAIGDYELPPHSGYSHNTYHGTVRHHRTPLNLDPKPLRFTDNPQLYAAFPPSSQRRRSSNTSNDSEVKHKINR